MFSMETPKHVNTRILTIRMFSLMLGLALCLLSLTFFFDKQTHIQRKVKGSIT